MDQEINIINTNTRIEKLKNFFNNNKKKIISIVILIIILLITYFSYLEFNKRNKIELAEKFNLVITEYSNGNTLNTVNSLQKIIKEKDKTYSPLALYFLIDNKLVKSNEEINSYFDIIINEVKVEKEIKNLIIFKKALFNSNFATENDLLQILNPVINSQSVWKSHALYLMAEYFFANEQKIKSKEFLNQIVELEIANPDIKLEAQKRIRRDFSE